MQLPEHIQPDKQPADVRNAIKSWNMMGSTLDWAALDVVTEILCITDVEIHILQLIKIKEFDCRG